MSRNQAPSKHVPLPAHVPRKPTARSRLTNQIGAILHGDARSVAARRYRDVVCSLVNEQGGPDQCSDIKLILIRRVAGITVLAEQTEAALCNGEEVDAKEMALLASTLARLSTRIGIGRVSKDVTPTLDQYVRDTYSKPKVERGSRSRIIDHDDDGEDDE